MEKRLSDKAMDTSVKARVKSKKTLGTKHSGIWNHEKTKSMTTGKRNPCRRNRNIFNKTIKIKFPNLMEVPIKVQEVYRTPK